VGQGTTSAGSCAPLAGVPAGAAAAAGVRGFREWLAAVPVGAMSDRERVDLVAELERVKGAAAAVQARAVHAVRVSRELVSPPAVGARGVGRSVGSQVALARRESPSGGDRFVRVSRVLVQEMPVTLAALSAGVCSEAHAVRVAQAAAVLCPAHRVVLDARVGPLLGRLGLLAAQRAARRVAAELDAAAVVRRMEEAVRSRRVTLRPARDGMAYLSVLGPMVEVAGAHAALQARARSVVGRPRSFSRCRARLSSMVQIASQRSLTTAVSASAAV
jgi:hypothetical protein